MASTIQQFLKEHGISEVEAIIPDMAGVARGKLMPAEKFAEEEGMRLPEAIFLQTVTGDYPEDQSAMNPSDIDIVLKADPKTVRVVPWAAEPTAQVIHDCFYGDGRPVTMSPQHIARVLPGGAEHRLGLPAEAPGGPLGAPRNRPAGLQHRGSERVRPAVRRHVLLLRSAGHRDRHAHP
jgi:glutamine synthetase